MRRLSGIVAYVSKGWIALLALAIFIAFGALVLPNEARRAEQFSGGAGSPDTNFLYSARDLYDLAEVYGPEGRAAYVRARYTFDVAFPLVYGFFLATSIGWLAKKVFSRASGLHLVNLVPLIGVAFDFLENISTSIVMLRYPNPSSIVAQLAPILSLIKWVFVYGSFLVLGLLAITWLVQTVQRQIRDRNS